MRLILTFIMLISASLTVFADEKKYTLNEILDSEISTDCSKITELESPHTEVRKLTPDEIEQYMSER